MKRYRFALESVLRVRRIEEEQAAARLQRANQRLRSALAARDAARERLRSLGEPASARDRRGLEEERRERALALAALGRAEEATERAATEVALAHVGHRSARQRVEMLERLDQRSRLAYGADVLREEARLLDDLAVAAALRDRPSPRSRS